MELAKASLTAQSREMAGTFDRRRANGPESTFQPLYNLSVSEKNSIEPVWNVNERYLLISPKSHASDNLVLHTMNVGEDSMAVPCIAQKSPVVRPDGRKAEEPRPLCMFEQYMTDNAKRPSNRHHSKC